MFPLTPYFKDHEIEEKPLAPPPQEEDHKSENP